MLEKIKQCLISINQKKEAMTKLQTEVEIKIADLDKLLDELTNKEQPENQTELHLNKQQS